MVATNRADKSERGPERVITFSSPEAAIHLASAMDPEGGNTAVKYVRMSVVEHFRSRDVVLDQSIFNYALELL